MLTISERNHLLKESNGLRNFINFRKSFHLLFHPGRVYLIGKKIFRAEQHTPGLSRNSESGCHSQLPHGGIFLITKEITCEKN